MTGGRAADFSGGDLGQGVALIGIRPFVDDYPRGPVAVGYRPRGADHRDEAESVQGDIVEMPVGYAKDPRSQAFPVGRTSRHLGDDAGAQIIAIAGLEPVALDTPIRHDLLPWCSSGWSG